LARSTAATVSVLLSSVATADHEDQGYRVPGTKCAE
jgi:hypothetical protein